MRKYKKYWLPASAVAVLFLLFFMWIKSDDSHVMRAYAKDMAEVVNASPDKRGELYKKLAEKYAMKFAEIMLSKSNDADMRMYAAHQVAALSPRVSNPAVTLGAATLFYKEMRQGDEKLLSGRSWNSLESMILALMPKAPENEKIAMEKMLGTIAENSSARMEPPSLAVYPITYADFILAGGTIPPSISENTPNIPALGLYFRNDTLSNESGVACVIQTNATLTPDNPSESQKVGSDPRFELAESVRALDMLGADAVKAALDTEFPKPSTIENRVCASAEDLDGAPQKGVLQLEYVRDCGRKINHAYIAEYDFRSSKDRRANKNEESVILWVGHEDSSTFFFNDISNAKSSYRIIKNK